MVDKVLPEHPYRKYRSANICIYCGSSDNLHNEHIIPLSLDGRWILPDASCDECGKKTSAFEGTCARTIFGPLRMLYGMRTRRKWDRPETLPLKVRLKPGEEWTTVEIRRDQYPFLVLLPLFERPDELTGRVTKGDRGASTNRLWIRGAFAREGFEYHLEFLARQLSVAEIMPTGDGDVVSFCLMLAKIAHSFVTAELGACGFDPFLASMITKNDTSNRAQFIGGILHTEPASEVVHEVSFIEPPAERPDILAVLIRLLACLETPTYLVAVGRRVGNAGAQSNTP